MLLSAQWKNRLAYAIASGAGLGFAPVGPGTFGTLGALPLVWAFHDSPLWIYGLATVFLFVCGAKVSDIVGKSEGKADSQLIVIDEIVGLMIAVAGIPFSFYWLVCGFVAFRFFDIVKPPPASYFDAKVKNGWGVMLDDVVAGLFANLLLRLMILAQI